MCGLRCDITLRNGCCYSGEVVSCYTPPPLSGDSPTVIIITDDRPYELYINQITQIKSL